MFIGAYLNDTCKCQHSRNTKLDSGLNCTKAMTGDDEYLQISLTGMNLSREKYID